jgi:hypothetical protein
VQLTCICGSAGVAGPVVLPAPAACTAPGVPPPSPPLAARPRASAAGAARAAVGVRGSAGENAEPAAGVTNALMPLGWRIGAQLSLDLGREKPEAAPW